MIIDSRKLPTTYDIKVIKTAIYQNHIKDRKNSIYADAKLFVTRQGKLKWYTFTLDTDKFFERVKGQEGKHYEAICRMKRVMEYASRFN